MKIATIVLAILLAPCSADKKADARHFGTDRPLEARAEIAIATLHPDSEAVRLVPQDLRYVIRAGQVFVVLAVADCRPGETPGSLQWAPPGPESDFVEVSSLCRCDSGGAVWALIFKPSNKHIGLHGLTLRTVGCDGSGREIGIEIKVKRGLL
jgi:hypothetical protein